MATFYLTGKRLEFDECLRGGPVPGGCGIVEREGKPGVYEPCGCNDVPRWFMCRAPLPLSAQVDYAVLASQAGATLNSLLGHAQDLVGKLRSLQLDQREFVCLKFLVLFSQGK